MESYKYNYLNNEIEYIVSKNTQDLSSVLQDNMKIAYICGTPEFDYEKLADIFPIISCTDNVIVFSAKEDIVTFYEDTLFLALNADEMTDPTILSSFSKIYCVTEVFKLMEPRFYFAQVTSFMRIAMMKDLSFYTQIIQNLYEIEDKDISVLYDLMDTSAAIIQFYFTKYPKEEWRKYLEYAIEPEKLLKILVTDDNINGYEIRGLALIVTAQLSYQHDRIGEDEYLEIRDLLVPFNQPISIESMNLEAIDTFYGEKEAVKITMLRHIGKLCFNDFVNKAEMIKAVKCIYYEETND